MLSRAAGGLGRCRGVRAQAQKRIQKTGEGQACMSARKTGVGCDRAFEEGLRKPCVAGGEPLEVSKAKVVVGPGIQPFRPVLRGHPGLVERDMGLQR